MQYKCIKSKRLKKIIVKKNSWFIEWKMQVHEDQVIN